MRDEGGLVYFSILRAFVALTRNRDPNLMVHLAAHPVILRAAMHLKFHCFASHLLYNV